MHCVDLEFRGLTGIIATAVLSGPDGVTLLDPGPTSCLPVLERGLGALGIALADVRTILLTHIHLDHAGVAGTILRRHPDIQVFVHERGARHLIDPSKLMDSATRLYGAEMDALWGAMLPVPSANVRVLRGGERLDVAGSGVEVVYTPGHASHHVSFIDLVSGIAYVGDTAGIRRGPSGFVIPPTPPPDIDIEAWRDSLTRVLSRRPQSFFITHFGLWENPTAHARELLDRLDAWSVRVLESLQRDPLADDEARAVDFAEWVRTELRARVTPDEAARYERAGRFDFSWQGLARYWRKRETPQST